MLSKIVHAGWAALCIAFLAGVTAVYAGGERTVKSDNMRLLANFNDGGSYRTGTDMAFWGDIALLGNLDQGTGPNATPPGGFRIMDIADPANPRKLGQFTCLGDQSDVSVWGDIVVLSVDKPTESRCSTDAAGNESNWEGIRIISIADRSNPQLLGTLKTDCGSHTNTIVPDLANQRLIVYVLSYPLAGRYNPAGALPTCNVATHRKFSVVEVPLNDPAKPKLLSTPSTAGTIGCHDVTVFLPRMLAAAACLTESQMWDISDPAKPEIVGTIANPRGMQLSHSTVFSLDGNTLVIGDEYGGAALSPGCVTDDQRYVSGGLFFFDVREPDQAELKGTYKLPREVASEFCTAHLFNVVPLRSGRNILVSSWYTGATSVIDFTDPAKPTEIAHHIPNDPVTPDEQTTEAAAWASYWYNGVVYSNHFDEDVNSLKPRSRGLDVFKLDDPVVADAVRLPRLNPQVQEPLPPVENTLGGDGVIKLPPQGGPRPGKPKGSKGADRKSRRERCRNGRRLAFRVKAPRGDRLRSVVAFVNGRRWKAVRLKRRRAQVILRRLPAGKARVDVTAKLRSGRTIERSRTYTICARKKG